jgi:hypothetical protein
MSMNLTTKFAIEKHMIQTWGDDAILDNAINRGVPSGRWGAPLE